MLATHRSPVAEADLRRWGGKGSSLIRLAAWGLPVPPFFVISSELFSAAWQLPEEHAAADSGEKLRALVAALGQEPEVRDRVLSFIREGLAALPEGPVAVRSSASDEDAAAASLAGQMDSFLYVPAEAEAIAKKVLACWQSLFSDRALSYRQQKGLSVQGLSIAVVVQTMCHADRSLVAFSANPLTRDPNEMLVSAAWGLGEGLVSGEVDADQYVLRSEDGSVRSSQIAEQDRMSVRSPEQGVVLQAVPEEWKGRVVLGDEDLKAVWELARTVQERVGRPVDIEAAFESGRLYVLQARPITTPIGGRKLLWDNSNIVESYSGVTTPLTFSFASYAYQTVYTLFGRMLGVRPEVHLEHERTMKTYVGLVQGRVYYNLLTWYMSMAYLPGYAFTRRAMEGMMGVRESLDYELPPTGNAWQKWTRDLPNLLEMVGRTAWYFATIKRLVFNFERNFEQVYGSLREERFEGWDAHRLVSCYHDLVHRLMHRWQAPIMTDVGAMVSYALLRKLCEKWVGESLQNELLAGEGGIESTQPTKRLMALAKRLQSSPEGLAALHAGPDTFFKAVQEDPRLSTIRQELDDWLLRYGDRCMNELKLEEPSLREAPEFLAIMLRNYVAMPDIDLEAMEARERGVRAEAEAKVRKAVANPVKRAIFAKVLGWTRMHVKNRENMRFSRTRMFGVLRRLFLAVGDDFVYQGVLRQREDIFYLTVDEITAYVDGRSVTRKLQALVDLRREEFEEYRQEEPDERFITVGLPYVHNRYHAEQEPVESSDPNVFQGTPCCPGVVENVTKLIRHPGDDMALNGEILVAPRTDPGWVALYPAVSGLLIEKGSILSHSAIVARELGLPTIVGIKGLCDRLNRGQRVRMDAAAGRVELLDLDE